MAGFVKHIGSFANKTAATTLAWAWPSSAASGNLIVCYLVFDNFTTASKPVVSSISKMAGETANWVFLGAARSTSTSGGAFGSGELWAIKTTVAWTTPTITATFDSSITMKSMGFSEFTATNATLRSTVGTAYSTTTTAATATTTGTAPVVGDLALGLLWQSNSPNVPAGDNDTTGGSWSAAQGVGSTGSTANSNNMGAFQYKVVTATTHQTFNNQATLTAGNGTIVAVLQAAPAVTPVASFSASATDVLNGGHVTFTDTSTNAPTSWAWDFGTGASPATASTQGPHLVTYTTPGTSTVTLTATNSAGSDAADTPASITVSANRYVQVADWTTPGTTSGSDQYKEVALTGLAAGDLLVAWGASNNWAAGTTRTITTSAGTTSAWTVNSPTPVVGADCDFVSGWATVTSGTTATVRVQIRGAPTRMGAGVWVIPAGGWGTPAFTHIGPTDVDGQVSTVVAGTSTVMFGIADWNALALSNSSTPSGALAGTNVQASNYSIAAREWTAQAAGTRAYGLSGTSGADIIGTVVVVPTTPTPKAATLTDTFDSQIDPAKWDVIGTTAWVSGQAEVREQSGTSYSVIISKVLYDLRDSYVFAKVTPPTVQTPSTETALGAGEYNDVYGMYAILYLFASTPKIIFRHRQFSTSDDTEITWDSVSMAYIRLSYTGGNCIWDTSPDGSTWTNRRTFASTVDFSGVYLMGYCGHYGSSTNTNPAYFDNFNVSSGGAALTYSASDTLGLTDVQTDEFVLPRSDNENLTDVRALDAGLARSDNENLTDTRALDAGLARTDSANLTDSVTTAKSGAATLDVTDPVGLVDAFVSDVTKASSDVANLTDSLTSALSVVVDRSDTLGLVDASVRDVVKAATDTSTLTDSTVRAPSVDRVDPVGPTDSKTSALLADRSDLVGSSDSVLAVIPPVGLHLFSGTPSITHTASDTGTVTGATEFAVASPANLTKMRYLQATNGGSTQRECALWTVDAGGFTGTKVLGPFTMPVPTDGQWCEYTLASPYTLTIGQRYRVAIYHPNGFYPHYPGNHYFDFGPGSPSSTVGGLLFLPDWADARGNIQGSFTYTPGGFPDGAFQAGCYFADVEVESTSGGLAWSRDVSDPLGVTDTKEIAGTLARTDNESITDVQTDVIETARVDLANLTDTVSAAKGWASSTVDALGLTDTVSVVKSAVYSTSDTLGLTDTFDGYKTSAGAVSATDNLGLTDTETSVSDLARADLVPLTDTVSAAKDMPYSASDTANLTDSKTSDSILVRSDIEPLTDAKTVDSGLARSDVLGLTDSITFTLAFGQDKSDLLGLSDTRSLIADQTRGDSVDITDSVTASKSSAGATDVTDSIGPADYSTLAVTKALADAVALSDSITAGLLVSTNKVDPLGVTDTWVLARELAKADGLNLTDSVSFTIARALPSTDVVGLTDSITTEKSSAGARDVTDLVGLVDTRALTATKALTDLSGLTDARALTTVKALTDLSGLTDTRALTTTRALADLSGLTDSFSLVATVGALGRPKVHTGAGFETKPGKVWNGSAWVEKPWKTWDGSQWKPLT